jgi:ABC-type transporter Mla subunit MlaD
MPDPQKIQIELRDLEDEIRTFDEAGADRLAALQAALTGQASPSAWSGVDLHSYIAPGLIAAAYRQQQQPERPLLRLLEGLRNVLVFVPIMVTWYGIAQASNAYHDLLRPCLQQRSLCPPDAGQPFLYLWQQGFDGRLAPLWNLSSVGLIDASLLLLVFLLTLSVLLLERRGERQREWSAILFESRLTHTVSEAALVLRSQRLALTPGENLADMALRIDQMAGDVLASFDRLASRIGQRFENIAQELERRFGQASDQLKTVADELLRSVETINQRFAQQFDLGQKQLEHLADLLDGSGRLASELQGIARTLQEASEAVVQGLQAISEPVQRLEKRHERLLEEIVDANDRLEKVSTSLTPLAQGWQRLMNSIDTLDLAVGQLASLATSLESTAQTWRGFLNGLSQERQAQEQMALRLGEALASLQDAIGALGLGAIYLRSIAVDMQDTLRLQAAAIQDGRLPVPGAPGSLSEAVQTLRQGGDELRQAATLITEVANAFHALAPVVRARPEASGRQP